MKTTQLLLTAVCACLLVFTACTSAPDAEEAVTTGAKKVTNQNTEAIANNKNTKKQSSREAINMDKSKITFIGTKPTGRHSGEFSIDDGALDIQDGQLRGGKFSIDINSLTVTDLKGEMKTNLEGHLKSPDFFDADKHPRSTFVITSIEEIAGEGSNNHKVSGNLTLLGNTQNVTFPASIVSNKDGSINAEANFNIDRTKWGLRYGNDKSLGDKFIRPEVNINVQLVSN